jgi:thiosulfate dehydrogenase [quinone] large subunit
MTEQTRRYTTFQATVLIVLQLFIGWHFLYEGLAKLMNPHWTAAG